MYNLGAQFKFDLDAAKGNVESTIVGKNYRFTVITESLIRLEYNAEGIFEDRPSQRVWYRNFPHPEFYVQSDAHILEIKTRYFTLTYQKESKFFSNPLNPTSNLKITPLNSEKSWYYKHPEARNYISPCGEFDKNNELLKTKGLYSTDGFTSIDDSSSWVFNEDGTLSSRNGKSIDVYVFVYGPLFYLCLNDYYKITGYPNLVPRYALGIWWYKDNYYDDYTLSALLNNFKDKKVPLSVLVLNNEWHISRDENNKEVKTSFTFDQNTYKEPSKMIEYLHKNKIRLGLTLNSTENIRDFEKLFQTATKYLKTDKNGEIPFNVFDNVFLDVYFKIFIHSLTNLDVDFFRLEAKDNAVGFYLNHYHTLDTKVVNNRRPLILTHDSYIAPHRYPVIATGYSKVCWDSLIKMCEYNLNLANRGISWATHAYGGFQEGIEESELYLRFVQMATFSPIFLLASSRGKYYKREPWKWDHHTFIIAREFMSFRQKLVPYLYTEGFRYTSQGIPIIEPIFYRYPGLYDDDIYHREYFLGSQLLVSPILNKKEEIMKRAIHRFFLPDGIWYDIYSGKKFTGNRKYVLFYSDENYPVFAKAGAIIPLGSNEHINDVANPINLEISFYPGASNSYILYEDDGISEQYKNNQSFQTDIEYNYFPDNYEITISPIEGNADIGFSSRNYKLILKNVREEANIEVMVDSKSYPFRKYGENNDLVIELNNVKIMSSLSLKCFGTNIETSNFRVVNDDIEGIISDLAIDTELKNAIDQVMFSNDDIKKKRIELYKLKKQGLQPRFVNLFLKLLDYIASI